MEYAPLSFPPSSMCRHYDKISLQCHSRLTGDRSRPEIVRTPSPRASPTTVVTWVKLETPGTRGLTGIWTVDPASWSSACWRVFCRLYRVQVGGFWFWRCSLNHLQPIHVSRIKNQQICFNVRNYISFAERHGDIMQAVRQWRPIEFQTQKRFIKFNLLKFEYQSVCTVNLLNDILFIVFLSNLKLTI